MSVLDNGSPYPVVTLTGSMQFFDRMIRMAEILTSQGVIVLMPWKYDKSTIPAGGNKSRDEIMQECRIDMSDELMVINTNGYKDDDTERDIQYAKSKGKRVTYLESDKPKIVTLIGNSEFREEFDDIESTLSMKGYIVFKPVEFTIFNLFDKISDSDRHMLDMVHRQKMEMSTKVIVVNKFGKINDETQRNIEWAEAHEIEVYYWYHTLKGAQFDAEA